MKVNLLIIDPQNDFCDKRGSLYVPGASEDMKRLADMIREHRKEIQAIDITLDSHRWLHIAHPIFWEDTNNKRPEHFTEISYESVTSGEWTTRLKGYENYTKEYLKHLKETHNISLTIWPPHCLIGSWGHCVFPPVLDSILYFEESFKRVNYHLKGTNPQTEHYSAIKPLYDPSGLQKNQWLLDRIKESDKTLIAGEAKSHCVAATVVDIIEELGNDVSSKLVILEDAMSNVKNNESLGDHFIEKMKKLGVQISLTDRFFKA